MAHEPKNYSALRVEHARALDALNQHMEPTTAGQHIEAAHDARAQSLERTAETAPTRPEGHPRQSPGWTAEGGLVEQQASAREWVKASSERRQQELGRTTEHAAALAALNQHIDNPRSNQTPAQEIDQRRDPDIER